MSTHTYKKFDDSDQLPDKMTVIQDCHHAFNITPVNAKKCRLILGRLLRLLYHGDELATADATQLFFSISKLFQHKDTSLRQLVYLAIKELSLVAQNVLMVTSSIMKDIQNGDVVYKPNAIRTLARIIDSSNVNTIERLIKNGIVDKNPVVSSAALLASYHLLPISKDVVKRWSNEINEALQSSKSFPSAQFKLHEYYGNNNLASTSYLYQYHSLGLLYNLRSHDRMALIKMITQLGGSSTLKSPLALIQLIRFINRLVTDDSGVADSLLPILAHFLKNKSDMVELEAAKTIIAIPHISSDYFQKALLTLQSLLTSPRTSTKFSAIRLLNKVSLTNPSKIVIINTELEALINDSNKSIQTYAITTLLKTGNSDNVDRLISKISSLMDDITDEFKIIVIESITSLTLKFPAKHKKMLEFLNDLLRDDGGFNLKNCIIESIFKVMNSIPEAVEPSLDNYCEFIEDCEFTELSVRVLFILGKFGPKASNPTMYIRHIYNRVVLENSIIRSAAVIALSKFAIVNDEVKKNVTILLKRCLGDSDDEVRDRAVISLKFINNGIDTTVEKKYDLASLESNLVSYINGDFAEKFDINVVPEHKVDLVQEVRIEEESSSSMREETPAVSANLNLQKYQQELSQIEELASYGDLLNSSAVVPLTETETEFVVSSIKHIFENHLVLQFNITNTLNDIELNQVSVVVQPDNDNYGEEFTMMIDELKPNSTGTIYVSFVRPDVDEMVAFGNTLSFVTKEIDPSTGSVDPEDDGFQDEYQIEDLEVLPGDFIRPSYISNFTHVYDQLEFSSTNVVQLTGNLKAAIKKLTSNLNMTSIEPQDLEDDSTNYTLKLFGKNLAGGNYGVLARLVVKERSVLCKLDAKGDDQEFVDFIIEGVA